MTRRHRSLASLFRHPAWLVAAAFALSCIGDTAGPTMGRPAQFNLVPLFQSSAPSGIVPIDHIHILLFRPGQTAPALDTTVVVAPGDTVVDLSLTVAVFTQADTFSATVDMLSGGVVVFHGGPLTVIGHPSQGGGNNPPPPVPVPVAYVGTGSDAASVKVTTSPIPMVMTGDTVTLVAVAKKADGTIIPNTPIGWVSLDTNRARIPNAALGRVAGRTQRGNARIVAVLLTGPADTVLVPVQLAPATIAVVSGSGQQATVRTALSLPLVAEVKASDNIGVIGTWVKFQVLTAGGGTVSADSMLTDNNGRASVNWTLGPTAGTPTVRATNPRLPGAQANFTANAKAGGASYVRVAGPLNQSAVVGTAVANPPTVVVGDADSNAVQGATVTWTVTAGGGSASAATQTTDAGGSASVGWTLGTIVGSNTLTASITPGPVAAFEPQPADSASILPAAAATTITFTVTGTPGPAAALAITGLTGPQVSVAADVTVTARDQYDNVAAGYRGTIQFSSTDGLAILPPNYTFTAGDNGTHGFTGGVTFGLGSNQTVTATDVATPSITGGKTVSVAGGIISTFAVTGLPATLTAGPNRSITVTARDALGGVLTSYAGTIAFTSNDPLATLPSPYTFVGGDNGVHTFTVALRTAGSRSVTVTDQSLQSATGSQAATVNPTTGAVLLATTTPDSTVSGTPYLSAGSAYTLTVAAKDTFANTLTGYAGTVHFTAPFDGNATLPADYTFGTGDQGVHVFTGVTLRTSGNQSIVLTDGTLPGSLAPFVQSGPASALFFTVQPTDAGEATPFSPIVAVTARDAYGNPATRFVGNVALALAANPSGGTLTGTTTRQAVAGVASFTGVGIDRFGSNYSLSASATGPTGATSSAFTITPAGMTAQWSGAASTDVSNGANWVGGSAPGPTANVFIPVSAPRYPVLTASTATNDLVVEQGASFTIGANPLQVTGNLAAGNTVVGSTAVVLSGTGRTLSGHVPQLIVTGSYALNDSVRVDADVLVSGVGASLTLAGHRMVVGGTFSTLNTGTITMTNNLDSLDVAGNTAFGGGNTGGLLTAGAIVARGDFVQLGYVHASSCFIAEPDTVETYRASGTHRLWLAGSSPQTLSLSTPRTTLAPPIGSVISECLPPYTGGSQLANLRINNPAGVSFTTTVVALGDVTVLNGSVDAAGQTTSAGGNVAILGFAGGLGSGLQAGGSLTINGVFDVETVTLFGNNPVVPFHNPLTNLHLLGTGNAVMEANTLVLANGGTFLLGNTVHVSLEVGTQVGSVTVTGTAQLNLNHNTLAMTGDFQTNAGGTIVMNNADDLLLIDGNAFFGGGDETGLLTSGTTQLFGDFTQFGNARSFAASGTHKVNLNGPSTEVISFDDTTQSHFQDLEIQNPNGIGLNTSVTVLGNLTRTADGPIIVWSSPPQPVLRVLGNLDAWSIALSRVEVGGVLTVQNTYTVDTTVFTGTSQTIPLSAPYSYPNLGVTGSASLGAPLTVPGDVFVSNGGSLDIGATTLTVGGNLAAGNTVVGTGSITMTGFGATVSGTMPTLIVNNGADVRVAGSTTVTGNASIYGHLSFGDPDAATTVMHVGGGLNFSGTQPSMHEDLDTLYVAGTATFINTPAEDTSLTGGVMALAGDYSEDGGVHPASTGTFKMLFNGTAALTLYLFNPLRDVEFSNSAAVTLGGNLIVTRDLRVSGSASLDVGGSSLDVGRDLSTANSGTLTMTNAAGAVTVHGNASFGGGSTSGLLTDGQITVRGNFTQSGNAQSFAAAGPHVTSFDTTLAQTITFANPDSSTSGSHFANLRIGNTSASGVSLGSDVFAEGQFSTADTTTTRYVFGQGYTLYTRGWFAGGSSTGGQRLYLDSMPVVVRPGAAIVNTSNVTLQNYDPDVDELTFRRNSIETHLFTSFQFPSIILGSNGHHVAALQLDFLNPPGVTFTFVAPIFPTCPAPGAALPGSTAPGPAEVLCTP